jgi:hypothetical protein
MSVLPGIVRIADASGNVRFAGGEGVGFCVVPMGLGAAFPVTVRLDNSAEESKNKQIDTLSTVIEAAGFDELELRGAVPGSQWKVVVLTDPADEYRPGPSDLALVKGWETIASFELASYASAFNTHSTAVDFANKALIDLGATSGAPMGKGVIAGIDVSQYEAVSFSMYFDSGGTSVVALAARKGAGINDPALYMIPVTAAPGAVVWGAGTVSLVKGAPLSNGVTSGSTGQAKSVVDGSFYPYVTPIVELNAITTFNGLKFSLLGKRAT